MSSVAQRLIVGYRGVLKRRGAKAFVFPVALQQAIDAGVAGIIFFRENFEGLDSPQAVLDQNMALNEAFVQAGHPLPFLSLDQEGGLVERISTPLFPPGISPMGLALAPNSEALCSTYYQHQAQALKAMGFTMNFAPCLDVNTEPQNPIIGVRAFGTNAHDVWRHARQVLAAYQQAGILAVGKHFPGHGSSKIDTHHSLPKLRITPEHITPFRQAIQDGLPAIMVAHAQYPQLDAKAKTATTSRPIATQLLRNELGFMGLSMSDDMVMGAITQAYPNPTEAMTRAFDAGLDVLIYREWQQELEVKMVIDAPQHQAALQRIAWAKGLSQAVPVPPLPQPFVDFSSQAIGLVSGQFVPLCANESVYVLEPDRAHWPHYAIEQNQPNLAQQLASLGFDVASVLYAPQQAQLTGLAEGKRVVFVTLNPALDASQQQVLSVLLSQQQAQRSIIVSAGMPVALPKTAHAGQLSVCHWRSHGIMALAHYLAAGAAVAGDAAVAKSP